MGSTLSVVRESLSFGERLREYGDLVTYEAFGERFVLVLDPEVVETVLVVRSDDFRKGTFEQEFGSLIAPQGVAFTEGEQWRDQRLALQGAFTPDRIAGYADRMVEETERLVEGWADGEVIEAGEAFSAATLRILARTLFDLDLGTDRGETVREATAALQTYVESFAWLSLLPAWLPTRTGRRYERSMAALDDLVEDLIAQRRRRSRAADGATGEDLLSLLATGDHGMEPAAIRDQLVTFLFAGHETTATALTAACWLLAGHPEASARLRREADALDGNPGFADVPGLDYTEAVAREALRLYPPVAAIHRQPVAETTLGGYRVPADVTLQLSAFGIHRDDRWWDDPGTFRPDRWLDDDAVRPEYAYVPFGGGPRHCIGMRFAMTELQLVLATLARRARFERVTEDLDLSYGVTLDPGPVEVRVHRRR